MSTLDPFEARVRFSNMLDRMNASLNSSQKAAQFATKHVHLSDDLHSCILEQLEKVIIGRVLSQSLSINTPYSSVSFLCVGGKPTVDDDV